jgi:predicted O-methyltransferase YrrM
MTLQSFLNLKNANVWEGHCQQVLEQMKDLINLTSKPNIRVMEIGFNAGHSAEVFLQNNSSLTLTSFDIGDHDYTIFGKQYIDSVYPGRHTLIIGDSTISVPKFIKDNNNTKFDVIFIDGGHDYPIANADLDNCFHLAHKDTIVVIDDIIFTPEWERGYTIGPTRSLKEHIEQNKVVQMEIKEYSPGHGMCWGKYIM